MIRQCQTMSEVRSEIDDLDQAIVELLAKRLQYIEQAARLKPSRNLVRDEGRVKDVLSKVKRRARAMDSDVNMVEAVYRHLIEYSINYEFEKFDLKPDRKGDRAGSPVGSTGWNADEG